MLKRLLLYSVPCLLLLTPLVHHAQFGGIPDTVSIALSPQFPDANQTVTASLNAYSLDTTGATISWFIDGIEEEDFRNSRSITFITEKLGVPTELRMRANLRNGQPLELSETIIPSRTDIIVEADTYTPAHYEGRALPSSGSTVRLIAIPVTAQDPASLTYSWQVDNDQLFGGPIVGKNIAEFEAPKDNKVLVRLTISDTTGKVISRHVEEISIVEPEIIFHEMNPLRGISHNALMSPYLLIADEITIRGEPYYLSNSIFNEAPLIEWKINNRTTNNPADNPRDITLRNIGGNGSVKAELHIRNLNNLLQGSEASFFINF